MTAFSVSTTSSSKFTLTGDDTLTVTGTGQLKPSGPAVTWSLATPQAGAGVVVTNSGVIAPTSGRAFDTSGSATAGVSFSLVNNAGASITAAGNIMRMQSSVKGGSISIDNAGAITSTGDRGFNIQEYNQLTTFTFTNRAGATGQSTDDFLRLTTQTASNVFTGVATVDNSGTLKTVGAGSGQVIDFNDLNTTGPGHVSIINRAGGLIESGDADTVRGGKYATLENSGVIRSLNASAASTGNDAVDFQGNEGGLVKNHAGGLITGARHGITGDKPVTVENAGTIEGRLGSGVNLDTATASITSITNFAGGKITGHAEGATDGDAVDVDGLVNLTNAGTIKADGTSASGSLTEALALGGGSVSNSGLISSSQRAVTVDNSDGGAAFGSVNIDNSGTIEGGEGSAILVVGDFADTITNSGVITGSISTGGGGDVVNLFTGATTGAIDGGAGLDTIVLKGSGAGSLAGTGEANVEALTIAGGDWTVSGHTSFIETTALNGGSVTFTTVDAAGTGAVQFGAGAQTLGLTPGAFAGGQWANTVKGFAQGDTLHLAGVGAVTSVSLSAGNLLTATTAGGTFSVQFDTAQSFAGLAFVSAADGVGGANITLTAKPLAGVDIASANENAAVTLDVLANDTDADGDALSLVSVTAGALGGQVSIVNGKVVYVANSDAIDQLKQPQTAVDTVTYQVQDSHGAVSTGTLSVTVKGVTDAPVRNGTAAADTLTGTAMEDTINGQGGADKLSGLTGADTLNGGIGNDTLTGGDGADRFVFTGAFGTDVVTDFQGNDVIQLDASAFANFAAVQSHAQQVGLDVVITLDAANTITLQNTALASLNSGDFLFV